MKYLHILFLAVVLAACSNDDDQWTAPKKDVLTLTVPIELRMSQPLADGTRAAIGDPGYDDQLDPPTILYVFSWIKGPKGDATEGKITAQYFKKEVDATDWVYNAADNYYRLSQDINLKYEELVLDLYQAELQTGKNLLHIGNTYVVATNKALTDAQVQDIAGDGITTTGGSVLWVPESAPQFATAKVTFDYTQWTSADFRDLYSNPANDDTKDTRGATNGQILYKYDAAQTDSKKHELVMGDVRLYHVAAKYDFTWEVAKDIQSTTAVNTITVTDLPTQCTIFNPVNNPTDAQTASAEEITTDVGSQWLGREVVYGLQRSDAKMIYDVTFKDVDGDGTAKSNVTTTFSPTKDNLFTGWYRVIATVK